MEGYLDITSAPRGETVTLYATTVAPTFTIEAYRMGWYQGLGGRLVWKSPPLDGKVQAPADADRRDEHVRGALGAVHAVPDRRGLAGRLLPPEARRVDGPAAVGAAHVRDDASTATYVIENAVTTWQAYNRWGGCSLYLCPGARDSSQRCLRPPVRHRDRRLRRLRRQRVPLIMRAEELNLDVTYTTDLDSTARRAGAEAQGVPVARPRRVLVEDDARPRGEQARDAGVNLAFFGANAVYRQIRFEPSALGPDRHMVNYRSTADPIRRTDPVADHGQLPRLAGQPAGGELIGQSTSATRCRRRHRDRARLLVWAGTGMTTGSHVEILVGLRVRPVHPRARAVPTTWRSSRTRRSPATAAPATPTSPITRRRVARACSPRAPTTG